MCELAVSTVYPGAAGTGAPLGVNSRINISILWNIRISNKKVLLVLMINAVLSDRWAGLRVSGHKSRDEAAADVLLAWQTVLVRGEKWWTIWGAWGGLQPRGNWPVSPPANCPEFPPGTSSHNTALHTAHRYHNCCAPSTLISLHQLGLESPVIIHWILKIQTRNC